MLHDLENLLHKVFRVEACRIARPGQPAIVICRIRLAYLGKELSVYLIGRPIRSAVRHFRHHSQSTEDCSHGEIT